MTVKKTREEIKAEIILAADDKMTEEEFNKKIEDALTVQESAIENEIIKEGNKILGGDDQPTTEYTIHVNIKHYVKVQASSKEEAFEKLKAHDFGQYIESPKDVRWHNETVIS